MNEFGRFVGKHLVAVVVGASLNSGPYTLTDWEFYVWFAVFAVALVVRDMAMEAEQ